jgi:gamma-D-glutamyl-L-lysine dipeptidyl-peptidase
VKSNLPFINVYKKTTIRSEVVTQLLYGDIFKKIKNKHRWIKIKNKSDNYKGFIKNKNFPKDTKNTHKILSLYANLYSHPSFKKKIKKKA